MFAIRTEQKMAGLGVISKRAHTTMAIYNSTLETSRERSSWQSAEQVVSFLNEVTIVLGQTSNVNN